MKNYHTYKVCIDACLKCAALCNHCANSSLQEEDQKMMAKCIQLDMECAAMCYAATQLMSLGSAKAAAVCKLCAEFCDACAAECSQHTNKHCQECAQACKECAKHCREMANAA